MNGGEGPYRLSIMIYGIVNLGGGKVISDIGEMFVVYLTFEWDEKCEVQKIEKIVAAHE